MDSCFDQAQLYCRTLEQLHCFPLHQSSVFLLFEDGKFKFLDFREYPAVFRSPRTNPVSFPDREGYKTNFFNLLLPVIKYHSESLRRSRFDARNLRDCSRIVQETSRDKVITIVLTRKLSGIPTTVLSEENSQRASHKIHNVSNSRYDPK